MRTYTRERIRKEESLRKGQAIEQDLISKVVWGKQREGIERKRERDGGISTVFDREAIGKKGKNKEMRERTISRQKVL